MQEELLQKIEDNINFAIDYQKTNEEEIEELVQEFIRPFDLSQAPLLRVGLIKITDTNIYSLYDIHHIISDGISVEILLQEFISLYQGKNLPELRIQYKDYAVWQNELFKTGRIQKQEEYWKKAFEERIPVLNLPTDYVRTHNTKL